MWERKITFLATDEEIETALPRLIRSHFDFSVQCFNPESKKSYGIRVAYAIKDDVARILYAKETK